MDGDRLGTNGAVWNSAGTAGYIRVLQDERQSWHVGCRVPLVSEMGSLWCGRGFGGRAWMVLDLLFKFLGNWLIYAFTV
jgi:hypothetical protein